MTEKKLSRLNTKRKNPLKTPRFWAIVLIPLVIALAATGILLYFLHNPTQQSAFTRVAERQLQEDGTFRYVYVDEWSYRGEPNRRIATKITVPAEHKGWPVTEIGANAFKDFTRLTTVNLPNTIRVIHDNAFNGCIALVSIVIPDSVIEIRASAFANCTALTSITLSQNMTRIDGRIFENTTSLTEIILPAKIARVDSRAFAGSGIKNVWVHYELVLNVVNDSFPFAQLENVHIRNDNTLFGQYWIAEVWSNSNIVPDVRNLVKTTIPIT